MIKIFLKLIAICFLFMTVNTFAGELDKGIAAYDQGHYKTAKRHFLKIGDKWFKDGDKQAQYYLGLIYEAGKGVPKNRSTAIYWYKKSAKQDYNPAQFKLGWLYYSFKYEGRYKDALYWFKQSAENNNANAQYMLGSMYEQGIGTSKNQKVAEKWYLKAASSGDTQALYQMATFYKTGENAIKWYKKASRKGHLASQLKLAFLYEHGLGVKQNYQNALYWYFKAATKGDPNGQYSVGYLIAAKRAKNITGKRSEYWFKQANKKSVNHENRLRYYESKERLATVKRYYQLRLAFIEDQLDNKNTALRWYIKVAEQGDMFAQMKVASIYEEGVGVSKNLKLSAKYYYKVAQVGRSLARKRLTLIAKDNQKQAQYYLGKLYLHGGKYVKKNNKAAFYWFSKSANLNLAIAQTELGLMYIKGKGTRKSGKKASYWFYRAAYQGNTEANHWLVVYSNNGNKYAQLNLGKLYKEKKLGNKNSYRLAKKWLEQSAKQGEVEAMLLLAEMLAPKKSAVIWYVKAAEQGDQKAIAWLIDQGERGNSVVYYQLAILYESGRGVDKNKKKAFNYFMRAAEVGIAEAEFKVGYYFENGIAMQGDLDDARDWYLKAAIQNNGPAKYRLGYLYELGHFGKADFKKAYRWYFSAAKDGDINAQFALAALYYGDRGEVNLQKAYMWAFIAKNNGFKTNGALKIIKSEMSEFEINRSNKKAGICLKSHYEKCD